MKYSGIQFGDKIIYRSFVPSMLSEIETLVAEHGQIEMFEIDQECFQRRIELANNYDEFKRTYLEDFKTKSDMSRKTFDKLTFDQKMTMFDQLWETPL